MAIQPLEAELFSLLGGDEKARIVARYCGFDGLGGTTLQTVGAEFGVTAERVRQIVGEVIRRRGNGKIATPTLSKAIAFVSARTPGFANEIETQLQTAGIASSPFRIEGMIRAAELLGKTASFSVTETQRARLVHALSPQSLDSVIKEARRAVERRGIANVRGLVNALSSTVPEAADYRLAVSVLTATDDFEWLGEPGDWFWLSSVPRNPIVRRIRKILAVANPVRFHDLSTSVASEFRLSSDAPPTPVVLDLCRQIPGIRIADGFVYAEPAVDPSQVLGELEQSIVAVLREHGGPMRRSDLAAACLQRGLNRSSFYSALMHSPVTTSHPGGLLGLIGEVPTSTPSQKSQPHRSKYLHAKARAHTIRLHRWME